jgi:hypothetical protein
LINLRAKMDISSQDQIIRKKKRTEVDPTKLSVEISKPKAY